jgi:hypothetical protein
MTYPVIADLENRKRRERAKANRPDVAHVDRYPMRHPSNDADGDLTKSDIDNDTVMLG